MSITIVKYLPAEHHKDVVKLITTIQQNEFRLPITLNDQPDLQDIYGFFDVFFVAIYQNQLVGTIGLKVIKNFAILRKMFVKKEFRGSKFSVGKKLLEAFETKAISINVEKVYLGTTEFFKAAHRFYEKQGYMIIAKKDLPLEFPVMHIDTMFYLKLI